MTKGDLFGRRSSWQSARSAIQRHARKAYFKSSKPKACLVCGYDKRIDVAHKKAVKAFPAHATIAEINALENLLGLCSTHHREYDDGLIEMEAGAGVEPTSPGL